MGNSTANCSHPDECPRLMHCERFRKRSCRVTFGLIGTLILMSILALYCRSEWLDTKRQLDRQRDLTDAAISSRDMWKAKHDILQSRKPLTARQRKLLDKYERAQLLEKK